MHAEVAKVMKRDMAKLKRKRRAIVRALDKNMSRRARELEQRRLRDVDLQIDHLERLQEGKA